MKILRLLVAVVLAVGLAGAVMAAEKAPGTSTRMVLRDYLIGRGDILEISVWKEEALTKSLSVLPDGKISFPLIGEVVAAGKTVAQLKE